MPKKTFNLKYASRNSTFFNKVSLIKERILASKKKQSFAKKHSEKDQKEITRGLTYAVFPELKEEFAEDNPITLEKLLSAMRKRGLVDKTLQTKVIEAVLQNRTGLSFLATGVMNDFFALNNHPLLMSRDWDMSLTVKNPNQVIINFTGKCQEISRERADAFSTNVQFEVTQDTIRILDWELTQISNNPKTKTAVQFLEKNQQGILGKLALFVKQALGFDCELRLESNSSTRKDVGLGPKPN